MSIPEIIEVIVTPAPDVIEVLVTPPIDAVEVLNEGPQGPRGPGITVSRTVPANPVTGDLWLDTSGQNRRLVANGAAIAVTGQSALLTVA